MKNKIDDLNQRLNKTSKDLAEQKGKVEAQLAVAGKYHENRKEIKELKEEIQNLKKTKQQQRQKISKLEIRIKELENIKFKKNK